MSPEEWIDTESFSEHLLADCCEGYERWLDPKGLKGQPEEYEAKGCTLLEDGSVEIRTSGDSEDVTPLLDEMVASLRATTRLATDTWRQCAKNVFSAHPTLLHDISEPQVPAGSYTPGEEVEVRWRTLTSPSGEHMWLPGRVVSVHKDGNHVVRFQRELGTRW